MVARVQIGFLPSADYGIRVSKPGVDVTTAGLADLVFATDFQEYAVVHQAGDVSVPNTNVTVGFPDLGYAPMGLFLSSKDSGVTWEPFFITYTTGINNDVWPRVQTEPDQFTVFGAGYGTFLFRYIILRVLGAT